MPRIPSHYKSSFYSPITLLIMSKLPLYPSPVHVKDCSICPNPLCCIKTSHEYQDLTPMPAIPSGVPQLEIVRFGNSNPFPSINCWKLVTPNMFDPESKPWVYLSEGYGTVRLSKVVEVKGWVLYDTIRDERLITRVALSKRRRWQWMWW